MIDLDAVRETRPSPSVSPVPSSVPRAARMVAAALALALLPALSTSASRAVTGSMHGQSAPSGASGGAPLHRTQAPRPAKPQGPAQDPSDTIAADFTALTQDVVNLSCGGTPGTVAIFGRSSFPLVLDGDGRRAILAAGRNAVGGRALAAAHTSWEATDDDKGRLWQNFVAWAGRKARPVVAFSPGHPAKDFFQSGGVTVRDFQPNTSNTDALKDIDVLFLNMHQTFTDDAEMAVLLFVQKGGGLALTATPWALDARNAELAERWLDSYGLAFGMDYADCGTMAVMPQPPNDLWSALLAVEALIQERMGNRDLSLEEKRTAAEIILQVLAARPDLTALNERLEPLSQAYGTIHVSADQRLVRASQPVEAMLTRYQFNRWQAAPPEQRAGHPSAATWPGLPVGENAATWSLALELSAPPDHLVNQGAKGRRVDTGLYAYPGRTIVVDLPSAAVGKGLELEIGIHVDANWHLDTWTRIPDIMRRDPLFRARTVTANPFGGLISIIVPPGIDLGIVELTIEGAAGAPHFDMERDDPADWERLKAQPGAWGFIRSRSMTVYASRRALQGVADPVAVASHWQAALELADRNMGYSAGRQRGEAALTDIQIAYGYGHAGYPFMMEYGDSDVLVDDVLRLGDWGFYHELGHAYQDSFDGAYTIATHAEVDVNLVPAMLMNLIHHRFPYDNSTHSTLDANTRLAARAAFLALPEDQQTWAKACDGVAAYDFYFNLAEAFGWPLYGRALGRIYASLDRPGSDPDLATLDPRAPDFKRDRLFLALSLEAGRNLAPYFARYGLGRGEFGLSQAARDRVKDLPIWTDNQPVTSLSDPGPISVTPGEAPGTLLHRFTATDPDPGTVFLFEIAAGNADGAFTLDRLSGELRTTAISLPPDTVRQLTVRVHDNALPRTERIVSFTVSLVSGTPRPTVPAPTSSVTPLAPTARTPRPATALPTPTSAGGWRLWLPLLERPH